MAETAIPRDRPTKELVILVEGERKEMARVIRLRL